MKIRSATATLIAVMENFGDSEPMDALVIYTDQDGDLRWSSTTDSLVVKLGLLDACREGIVAGIVRG